MKYRGNKLDSIVFITEIILKIEAVTMLIELLCINTAYICIFISYTFYAHSFFLILEKYYYHSWFHLASSQTVQTDKSLLLIRLHNTYNNMMVKRWLYFTKKHDVFHLTYLYGIKWRDDWEIVEICWFMLN